MKSVHLLVALSLVLFGCGEEKAKKEGPKAPAGQTKKVEPVEQEGEKAVEKVDEAAEVEKVEPKEEQPAQPGTERPGEARKADIAPKAPAIPGDEELASTVVAKVNDRPIDIVEYAESIKKRNNGKLMRSQVRKNVVERMINEELIRQAIEEAKIVVTDQDVAAAMDIDAERFASQKETMGKRVKTFTERVGLERLLAARGLIKEPTEEELAREYENRFSLKLETVYLPLAPGGSAEDKAKVVESAQAVLTKVAAGGGLRDAVKEMTDYNGRRLSVKPLFIKKGDERNKLLWEAANPLEEKAFAGPVELADALVVFQLIKRNQPKESFDELKPKLRKTAMTMRVASARHRLVEELRQNAKVEYLVKLEEVPLRPGGPRPGMPMPMNPLGRAPQNPSVPGAVRGVPKMLPPGVGPRGTVLPATEGQPAAPAPEAAPAPAGEAPAPEAAPAAPAEAPAAGN